MLAVDIGNTFTRVVAFSGGSIRTRRSFPTRELEPEALRNAFAEGAERADAPSVWIASVYPAANALVDAAAGRAGLACRFVRPGADPVMPHALRTPATTGADRLLSAMAAGERHFSGGRAPGGYVVVQCGSAVTVDLVDGSGVFRGGYILPGPAMWLAGLAGGAQLPDLSGELPDWGGVSIGDNTHDALMHGMQLALPAAAAEAARRIAPPGVAPDVTPGVTPGDREPPPAVVTGGWGEAVLPYMRQRAVYDPDLLLHGLRLFAERNA